MTYRLAEIDLTRHVRTPAGVAYFHKPIGSPIGGGKGSAPRGKKSGITYGTKAPPVFKSASLPLSPKQLQQKSKRRQAQTIAKAIPPPSKKVKARPVDFKAKRAQMKSQMEAAEVRREMAHARHTPAHPSEANANLWQLDNKRLQDALNDPRTPADRKRALKVERAQRVAAVSALLSQHKKFNESPEVKAAIASGDMGRITKAVDAHAPRSVKKAFHKLADAGVKVKDADHAQSVMDAIWDFIIKAAGGVVTVGIIALAHGLL